MGSATIAAVARRARILGAAFLCCAGVSSAAQAAVLNISVPAHVRLGHGYTIAITGSFRRNEVRGRAFLIAAIQFGDQPCQLTAREENQLRNKPQFYLGRRAGVFESRSPFTRRDGLVASAIGTRHVCAWLYPRSSGPNDRTLPIASDDVSYVVRG